MKAALVIMAAGMGSRYGGNKQVDGIGPDNGVKYFDWYRSADYSPYSDVEDMATAYIRFEGGKVMSVETSFSQNVEKEILTLELYGTKGGIRMMPDLKIFTKVGDYLADVTPIVSEPKNQFNDMFAGEIAHFVELVEKGETRSPISPPEDGIAIMQILESVYKSAAENKEIVIQ